MLDNAKQHYWKLVVERLCHIAPCRDRRMHFAKGGRMYISMELVVHNQQVMMYMWTLLEHCWKNRCWTCIELAREVGYSPDMILHILKKKLKMRKICARWVPQNLKKENIWQRMETVRLLLECYGLEGERFLRMYHNFRRNPSLMQPTKIQVTIKWVAAQWFPTAKKVSVRTGST